jgi:hypothetical protein
LRRSRPIRAAGLRWPAEEDFEFGKDCFGLDQSQVRLHTAIARHTVLVMTALAMAAAVLEPPAKFRPVDPLGGPAPAFPEPASGPEREPGQELDGVEDEKRNYDEGCGRTDDRQG